MSLSQADFWKLLAQSELLPSDSRQRLEKEYLGSQGASSQKSASGRAVAEWLISKKKLTLWQAKVLLHGAPGPFVFSDYQLRGQNESTPSLFRAVHLPSNHPVAIGFLDHQEMLPAANSSDASGWTGLVSHARRLARLDCPYLARCYEAIDLGRYRLTVYEDISGMCLADRLAKKPMSINGSSFLIFQLAQALAEMHRAGIPHGLVRPESIGLRVIPKQRAEDSAAREGTSEKGTRDDQKRAAEKKGLRQVALLSLAPCLGSQVGRANGHGESPDVYLAPELRERGQKQSTLQGDVYSLGRLFYGMIARELKQLDSEGGKSDPTLPVVLKSLIKSMTASDPANRFESAEAVVGALTPILGDKAKLEPPDWNCETLSAYEDCLRKRLPEPFRPDKQSEIQSELPGLSGLPSELPLVVEDSSVGGRGSRRGRSSGADSKIAKRSKSKTPVWILLACLVTLAVGAGTYFAFFRSSEAPALARKDASKSGAKETGNQGAGNNTDASNQPSDRTGSNQSASNSKTGSDRGAGDGSNAEFLLREVRIPDDGETLWASPTSGRPIRLRYMPPGAQMFLHLRGADLVKNPEYKKLRHALGPLAGFLEKAVRTEAGFDLPEIEELTVGLRAPSRGTLGAAYVVRLTEPIDDAEITQRWPGAAAFTHEDVEYFKAGELAVYLPLEEKGRLLVVSSEQDVREVIETGGAEPPLRRETEEMLAKSDRLRSFTLIVSPNFLFADGEALWSGAAVELREPVADLLGDSVQSALLSLHLGDSFFLEWRTIATAEVKPVELVESLRGRVSALPSQVENYLLKQNPHPYGRLVLYRLPQMVHLLDRHTRGAKEEEQAVLRCVLPPEAAHNLLFGLELTLAEGPGGASVSGGSGAEVGGGSSEKPQTVEEKLAQRTTLSFPQDTLEMAVKFLADDIGVEIRISGGDLETEGITKNQSFGIDLQDKTAGEILTQILLLANSDKTATGPSDTKQKLVYVIKPLAPNGPPGILVTTRAKAAQRGETLPKQFIPDE